MNASFFTLGALLVVGAALTGGVLWRRGPAAAVARLLLAGAGVGFVLAGLAPADVNENQHVLGALLIMAMGNIGLFLAGSAWQNTFLPHCGGAPACWASPRSRLLGSSSPTTTSVSAWEVWSELPRFLSCSGRSLLAFVASSVGQFVCRRRCRRSVSAALVESSGQVPVGLPRRAAVARGSQDRFCGVPDQGGAGPSGPDPARRPWLVVRAEARRRRWVEMRPQSSAPAGVRGRGTAAGPTPSRRFPVTRRKVSCGLVLDQRNVPQPARANSPEVRPHRPFDPRDRPRVIRPLTPARARARLPRLSKAAPRWPQAEADG